MSNNHYTTLGIPRSATASEIKSAYRRLVMENHPDRNPSAKAKEVFLAVTAAYEVLGDTDRRRNYDVVLDLETKRAAEPKRVVNEPQTARAATSSSMKAPFTGNRAPGPTPTPQSPGQNQKITTIAADVTRLTLMFTRGKFIDAEDLARQILTKDPRQPIPYAVLGDIQRSRGNFNEASKMYAFAVQMDPRNPKYVQRYEELMNLAKTKGGPKVEIEGPDREMITLLIGGALLLVAAIYVVVAPERAIFPNFALLSSWTLGLMVMLFLSGVIVGSVLSAGNFLDRFVASSTSTLGKASPLVALGTVAIVNFWAAAVLYALLGLIQRTYNQSATRLLLGVGTATFILTLAAVITPAAIIPGQVLLWGGNLVYIGSICGWMVADGFRR